MDQTKRKLTFNQSSEEETKKLRNQSHRSVTCLEDLSNEIFYQIFDDLTNEFPNKPFSNLNSRFGQLLNSPSVRYEIRTFVSVNQSDISFYPQLNHINKHQIVSINVSTSTKYSPLVPKYLSIDSSFVRLETLVLRHIRSDILITLLINSIFLPRLSSLTIEIPSSDSVNLTHIYQLIFTLRQLNYTKLILEEEKHPISLLMATNQQLTTIKSLILDHCVTFSELSTIISYTPDLRRLHFSHTDERDTTIGSLSPIALTNLTYLSLRISSLNFHDFEIFIGKIHSKLMTLSVNISSKDITYLNAYRWERLIVQHLSELKKFSFQYLDPIDNEHRCLEGLNQFCSSFWIQQQWIFDVEFVDEGIVYVIRPYKKRWYEYTNEKMVNSSADLCQANRLIVHIDSCDEFNERMTIEIQHILTAVQLYHLEIRNTEIDDDQLVQVIDSLPHLISIKIYSLSLTQGNVSCETIVNNLHSTKTTNKITKIYLDDISKMNEVYFLMKLCPHLTYLRIDWLGNIDAEFFVEEILKKINEECHGSLRCLCFFVAAADEKTITMLEELIDSKKLLRNYTIKRVVEHIYLHWK